MIILGMDGFGGSCRLLLPLIGFVVSSDGPCNQCSRFQVVYAVAVVEEEVLVGIVIHPLLRGSRPEPVAQEIPLASIPFKHVVLDMGV